MLRIDSKHTYDGLGQLIRENNRPLNCTYVYEYDNAGNRTARKKYAFILNEGTLGSPTSTDTYTYSTGTWGDQLTGVNGSSITYDAIGNPTSITSADGFRYEYGWDGRLLTTVYSYYPGDEYGTLENIYTYNADGIRIHKNMWLSYDYYYVVDGSRIVSQTWLDSTMVFMYDENGAPIGIKYRTDSYIADEYDVYYFEKNLQGDIVAVYNATGTKICTYHYDAWGKCSITYHVASSHSDYFIASENPFRYRGYYYDWETGWCYLQSRYYNPNWGRFLNADAYVNANRDIIGYNMYAYCSNNPVMFVDESGTSIRSWFEDLMASTVEVTVDLCIDLINYNKSNIYESIWKEKT